MILGRECQRRAIAIIRLTFTTIISLCTVQFYNTKSPTNIFSIWIPNTHIKQTYGAKRLIHYLESMP